MCINNSVSWPPAKKRKVKEQLRVCLKLVLMGPMDSRLISYCTLAALSVYISPDPFILFLLLHFIAIIFESLHAFFCRLFQI